MLDFNRRPKTRSTIDPRRTKRAERPRPLVTMRAVEKLLLRHVHAPTTGLMPEQRLIVAVLCQAIADARYGESQSVQDDAERFLRSNDLAQVAGLIDLTSAFVREVAVKTGYLLEAPDELEERSADARLQ